MKIEKKGLIKFNQKNYFLYIIISFLLSTVLFIYCSNIYINDLSKNKKISKSIMSPSMIDSFNYTISHIKKDFIFSEENKTVQNIQIFGSKLKKFGMELKKHEFEYNNKKGLNYYSVLLSRKENNAKYYLLAFDYNNAYELLAISAFLENFFQRAQTLALNLVLLGRDKRFSNFSISTEMFLKDLYSENKFIDSLNFMRDGMNIDISFVKDKESAFFYYICILKRWS